MFLDASAIVAILVRETDSSTLQARLAEAATVEVSPIAIFEAVLAIARTLNVSIAIAKTEVDNFVREIRAQIVPISAEIGHGAIDAFARFGRGRHRAQLNM